MTRRDRPCWRRRTPTRSPTVESTVGRPGTAYIEATSAVCEVQPSWISSVSRNSARYVRVPIGVRMSSIEVSTCEGKRSPALARVFQYGR